MYTEVKDMKKENHLDCRGRCTEVEGKCKGPEAVWYLVTYPVNLSREKKR